MESAFNHRSTYTTRLPPGADPDPECQSDPKHRKQTATSEQK